MFITITQITYGNTNNRKKTTGNEDRDTNFKLEIPEKLCGFLRMISIIEKPELQNGRGSESNRIP